MAAVAVALGLCLGAGLLAGCGEDEGGATGSVGEPLTSAGSALTSDEREQVAVTLRAVSRGGPFPYEQDGETFFNREGLLPDRPTGHYREYTVETPGSDDRGARRLVIGADGRTWFTRDHYGSFVEIDPQELREAPD